MNIIIMPSQKALLLDFFQKEKSLVVMVGEVNDISRFLKEDSFVVSYASLDAVASFYMDDIVTDNYDSVIFYSYEAYLDNAAVVAEIASGLKCETTFMFSF